MKIERGMVQTTYGHLQKTSTVGGGVGAERAVCVCRPRAGGQFPGPGVDLSNQSSELLWEAANSECGKQARGSAHPRSGAVGSHRRFLRG